MTTPLQYGMGGDRPYSLYYRHSGQTPLGAIVLAGAVGIAAGIVTALVYAYAVEYIPFAKLRFVATLFFGMAVGAVTTRIAKAGKVRSAAVALALVGVVTLVAYYFAWVFWIKAVFDRYLGGRPTFHITHAMLITRPALFVRSVQMLNENGTWAMSKADKENVRGTFLAIVWLIEAATIFAAAFGVAFSMLKADVFCEACRRWCGKPATLRRVAPGDPQRLRQSLEAHDFSYLNTLAPAAGHQFWTLEHFRCRGCDKLHALSVKENKQVVNKKGQVQETKSKVLIDKLLLAPEDVPLLLNPQAPARATPAAVPTAAAAAAAIPMEPSAVPHVPPPPPPSNPLLPGGQ